MHRHRAADAGLPPTPPRQDDQHPDHGASASLGDRRPLRAAAPLPVAWSQRVTFCESLTGKRITEFDGAFGLTTKRDDRFAEPGQQVPQPVVEDVLRAHLRATPGVQLRVGHTVTGLAQDGSGATVAVRDGDGSAYAVRARYVLGCDGASSVVREQIGARFAGRSDPRPNFNVVFRASGLDTSRSRRAVLGGRRPHDRAHRPA